MGRGAEKLLPQLGMYNHRMARSSNMRREWGLGLGQRVTAEGGHQRCGLRSGNGTFELLASSACRVAGSSLGGGGPLSLLARALRIGSGIVSASAGTGGSKPTAVRMVPHSCGSLLIVGEDLRRAPVAGCPLRQSLLSSASRTSW